MNSSTSNKSANCSYEQSGSNPSSVQNTGRLVWTMQLLHPVKYAPNAQCSNSFKPASKGVLLGWTGMCSAGMGMMSCRVWEQMHCPSRTYAHSSLSCHLILLLASAPATAAKWHQLTLETTCTASRHMFTAPTGAQSRHACAATAQATA